MPLKTEKNKAYTTTTESNLFGELCWNLEGLSGPVVDTEALFKNKEAISTTKVFLLRPHLSTKKKFVRGARWCMVSFSNSIANWVGCRFLLSESPPPMSTNRVSTNSAPPSPALASKVVLNQEAKQELVGLSSSPREFSKTTSQKSCRKVS